MDEAFDVKNFDMARSGEAVCCVAQARTVTALDAETEDCQGEDTPAAATRRALMFGRFPY